MKWSICVLVYYNSFSGEFCIKSCCMFVDMANSYLYIITHVYLWAYIDYVPTTYLLYICYINLQHSLHLCSFCYFSDMLFIINILTIDMLGIYHWYSDIAWWMFCVVHILLYICKTFFNIIYWCIMYYVALCKWRHFQVDLNTLFIIKYLNLSTLCLLLDTLTTCARSAMRHGNMYLYIPQKAWLVYWSTSGSSS